MSRFKRFRSEAFNQKYEMKAVIKRKRDRKKEREREREREREIEIS
jgi:hypothetical protein